MSEAIQDPQPGPGIVRLRFKGGDRSYRECLFRLTFREGDAIILKAIEGSPGYPPKEPMIRSLEEIDLYPADTLWAAYQEAAAPEGPPRKAGAK